MRVITDHFPGGSLTSDGRSALYFGGTAYLGLQTHKDFINLYTRAIDTWGTTYAASRLSNVQLSAFERGESWLAQRMGAEEAIYVSSGFLSCQLVRKHFATEGNPVFFAPNTHSALQFPGDECYQDAERLKDDLWQLVSSQPGVNPVLIFDTVDFKLTQPLNLEWLADLPLKEMILVGDDSHGIGICGENGGGNLKAIRQFGAQELLICGSLGKGFGISGGMIAGESGRMQRIKEDPWYGGSGPGTAAGLQTLMDGEAILDSQREKLLQNIDYFSGRCSCLDRFGYTPGYPCYSVFDNELATYLFERGIVISHFNYPNKNGPVLCRLVITAAHSQNDIDSLAEALNNYFDPEN